MRRLLSNAPPGYKAQLDRTANAIYKRAYSLGISWKELALRANLDYRTVQRLGDGITVYPWYLTLYSMAPVVGYQLPLVEPMPGQRIVYKRAETVRCRTRRTC